MTEVKTDADTVLARKVTVQPLDWQLSERPGKASVQRYLLDDEC